MSEIEIPPYFICPISFEIMKDPVTVATGVTYDRESIERWIFSRSQPTCPVTKQPIDLDLEPVIPNITLRRLIQSWCTLHEPDGYQRLPTPKAPVRKLELAKIIDQARRKSASPQTKIKCLQKLRLIASQSQTNRRCMELAETHDFLASLIVENVARASDEEIMSDDSLESRKTCDEAIEVLYMLQLSESGLKSLDRPEFIESLTLILRFGSYNYESRACTIMLLRSVLEVADPSSLINLPSELFTELRHTLDDQISQKANKETLKTLIVVCPWGRNRMKAVESGMVPALIDLLMDSSEKRVCEMMLAVLDLLCQCADGRAALLSHGAGLAVVAKKILRVSRTASDKGVRILQSVSRFCAGPAVLHEMLQVGVVAKLCLAAQVDCGAKAKERAREILKSHARAWRDCPCLPRALVS